MRYKKFTTSLFLGLTFCLPLQNSVAKHAQILTPDIEFSCDQTNNTKTIECAYRFVEPNITKKISASLNDIELPILEIKTYPFPTSKTSVLFLVDRTKAENPEQIQQIRTHIATLAEQALPYQQIGLASFGASLKVIEPLGSTPDEVKQAAEDIIETEQSTDIYKSLLDALELLKANQADRKAIYLFTAGHSQSLETYPDDVINAATASNIRIITLYYPAIELPSESEQALKRLTTNAGGNFYKASEDDLELSEDFLYDPFAAIDNGGVLSLSLEPVLTEELEGEQEAKLTFDTSSKSITVKLPLELSTESNATNALLTDAGSVETNILNPVGSAEEKTDVQKMSDAEDKTSTTPAPIEDRSITYEPKEELATADREMTKQLQYRQYIPFIAGSILLISFLLFLRTKKKKIEVPVEEIDDDSPIAYLVALSDDSLYYPIYNTPWTVGRAREKDIFLEHSSVSRNHAEFTRARDGSLSITDLDSLNGIYINNNKVRTGILQDQDRVDIGDVRLKFIIDKKVN